MGRVEPMVLTIDELDELERRVRAQTTSLRDHQRDQGIDVLRATQPDGQALQLGLRRQGGSGRMTYIQRTSGRAASPQRMAGERCDTAQRLSRQGGSSSRSDGNRQPPTEGPPGSTAPETAWCRTSLSSGLQPPRSHPLEQWQVRGTE